MSDFARIQVQLDRDEWNLLRELAQRECRDPRQQARFMLKQVLEGTSKETGLQLGGEPVSQVSAVPNL